MGGSQVGEYVRIPKDYDPEEDVDLIRELIDELISSEFLHKFDALFHRICEDIERLKEGACLQPYFDMEEQSHVHEVTRIVIELCRTKGFIVDVFGPLTDDYLYYVCSVDYK